MVRFGARRGWLNWAFSFEKSTGYLCFVRLHGQQPPQTSVVRNSPRKSTG
jgi:hypothetical protein